MMGGNNVYSPPDQSLSPNSNLCITIEEVSQSSEQLVVDGDDDLPIVGDNPADDLHDCDGLLDEFPAQSNGSEKCSLASPPPATGMEFDSYDDAYSYYNSYARDLGFAIRVKSSWTKRNSKEKRGAVLCCNCEGFKTLKEPNSTRRKETRTGCQAMIRLRLIELDRWKVDEVKLDHNHSFDPERAHNSKSHKKACGGGDGGAAKRKHEPPLDVQVRTIKLYRTNAIDSSGETSDDHLHSSKRLDLRGGGGFRVLQDFFFQSQLTNPNFFHSVDLGDDGGLRNVFWIESRARAAYSHFSDVVVFDTTCLSNAYELPLVAFVGINHHGDPILLGCGLVADQTPETYVWLFRAWLTCVSGCPPLTFVTEHCKSIQTAVSEVFPRAHHRLSLSHVLQCIVGVQDSESFRMALNSVVYGFLKVEEFEVAWEEMIIRFGLTNDETIRGLFQDREQWAPVYLKDTFLAGALTFRLGNAAAPFIFSSYVHQHTSLREFLEGYESFLDKKYTNEALCDLESSKSIPELKTTHPYESQMAKVLTKEIFTRFQEEVVATSSCSGVTQVHSSNGSASSSYVVKEREGEKVRDFEVVYETNAVAGVRCFCVCGGFSFNGYQCRHVLLLLSHKGLEEIPSQYILQRWRKDVKRLYIADFGSGCVDVMNPVQWYEHLHRRAMQVVEQGMRSKEHCRVAWEAFKECVNRVTEKSS
ncbi:hypothetical protein Bca4012_100188 [Brassica carinata]